MLQFSVRALLYRLHEAYLTYKHWAGKVATVTAAYQSAQKTLNALKDDHSVFSSRMDHIVPDRIVVSYLISLLWVDLYRKQDLEGDVGPEAVDSLVIDSLGRALDSIKEGSTGITRNNSVNDLYEDFLRLGVQAYLVAKAPAWDSLLERFFARDVGHVVIEGYVTAYHDAIVASPAWRTKIQILYPDQDLNEAVKMLGFIKAIAADPDNVSYSVEANKSMRTSWFSYLPSAMFLASQQVGKLYLLTTPNPKQGQFMMSGVPALTMVPASYGAMHRKAHVHDAPPPHYLKSLNRRLGDKVTDQQVRDRIASEEERAKKEDD